MGHNLKAHRSSVTSLQVYVHQSGDRSQGNLVRNVRCVFIYCDFCISYSNYTITQRLTG